MDPPSSDVPKLPDMVMCGDHPSFTKTELNVKEVKPEDKDKPKEIPPMSYARISPKPSHTERTERVVERAARAASEHGLRARRREPAPRRAPLDAKPNKELVQAALGSFRWPPYLLCVWVLVLVLTHLLHCLVSLLERTLPNFKKLCQYFRKWTEESWRRETELNQRVYPCCLAALTAALYALYAALSAALALALWAVEPLCPDDDKYTTAPAIAPEMGLRVTNYVDEVPSNTSYAKHN